MFYLIIAFACWLITIPLHRYVKRRMRTAGLRPRHFVGPFSAAKLYRDYLIEAPGRSWPSWPVYVLRVVILLMLVELASGFAAILWFKSP